MSLAAKVDRPESPPLPSDPQPAPPPASAPCHVRRSWRYRLLRVAVGSGLLLGTVAIGAIWYVSDPGRLAGLVEPIISNIVGGKVEIGAAHASWRGPIRLEDVRLRVPGMPRQADTIFSARTILIDHSPDLSGLLRFRATTVSFVEPKLYLIENLDRGAFNFELLLAAQTSDGRAPEHFPEVYLGRATAEFGQIQDGRYEPIETVELTGNLRADGLRPGGYTVTLVHHAEQGRGAALEGWFNTATLEAEARLERFGPQSPLLNVLPRRVRQWWRRLEPTGRVTPITFGYSQAQGRGFFAHMAVDDFELTLPYGEYASHMTRVSGAFDVRGDAITFTNLRGSIEGIDYQIDGRVLGFDPDAATFAFDVRVDGSIPEQPRYMFAMPPQVQKMFDRFRPSGRFNAQVKLHRSQAGAALTYEGQVRLDGVKGRYAKFPYPIEQVHGVLSFDPQVLRIEAFSGRGPHGAAIAVAGSISPPQDGAAVDIDVVCRDIVLDDQLFDAMKPKHQEICRKFLDSQAWRRLVDSGLIRPSTADDETPDTAEQTPAFDLGGRINALVHVRRAYGQDQDYRNITEVNLAGARGVFRHWPYPLTVREGRLVIGPDGVRVQNAVLDGLSGAVVRIDGHVQTPDERTGRLMDVDLDIQTQAMPVDPLLVASVHEPQDKWLRQLQLDGVLDGGGRIFHGADNQIDYQLAFTLRDGLAQPYGGAYQVVDLGGEVTLSRDRIGLLGLTGRHHDSFLLLSGEVDWTLPEPQVQLKLKCQALRFEDPVLDLLPPEHAALPQLRRIFADHQPRGAFDAELDFWDTAQRHSDYRLQLRPADLRIALRGQDVPLTDMTGQVLITPDGVSIDNMAAAMPHGSVRMDATMRFGDQPAVTARFDLSSDRIGPYTRAVLPEGILRAVDGLTLQGQYAIQNATLVWEPEATGRPVLEFQAPIQLRDASAQVGVPVTDLQGALAVVARLEPGQSLPAITMRLDASSLRAMGRLIEKVQVQAHNPSPYGTLLIDDLRGYCYGGVVVGRGRVVLTEPHGYRFSLSIQDVAHQPFVQPAEDQSWIDANAVDEAIDGPVLARASGSAMLSASLDIEGVPTDSRSRLGRGDLFVRDAHLVRTPLAMALLHIVNLNFPGSGEFDRAAASFLVEGDMVHIDRFSLEAPTVAMVGGGRMRYSDKALDLRLYSRNPAGPDLGPLTDLFNVLKDELLSVHVTGTLDQPQTQTQTLAGVSGSIDDIFGEPNAARKAPVVAGQ